MLAQNHLRVAIVEQELGESKKSLVSIENALRILEFDRDNIPSDSQSTRIRAQAHNALGNHLMNDQGKRDEGAAEYRLALKLLKELDQREPNSPLTANDLSVSYDNLAVYQRNAGNYPEAISSSRQALGYLENAAKARPDDPDYRKSLVVSGLNLATLLTAGLTGSRSWALGQAGSRGLLDRLAHDRRQSARQLYEAVEPCLSGAPGTIDHQLVVGAQFGDAVQAFDIGDQAHRIDECVAVETDQRAFGADVDL